MGTDWFIKAECPRPNKKAKNKEEHIKACSDCPFVIWMINRGRSESAGGNRHGVGCAGGGPQGLSLPRLRYFRCD